jgi:Tfp pilus assembly ATPase PilU
MPAFVSSCEKRIGFILCDEDQLRFVHRHFRCWLAHLELRAHFLDFVFAVPEVMLKAQDATIAELRSTFEVAKTFSCFSDWPSVVSCKV